MEKTHLKLRNITKIPKLLYFNKRLNGLFQQWDPSLSTFSSFGCFKKIQATWPIPTATRWPSWCFRAASVAAGVFEEPLSRYPRALALTKKAMVIYGPYCLDRSFKVIFVGLITICTSVRSSCLAWKWCLFCVHRCGVITIYAHITCIHAMQMVTI